MVGPNGSIDSTTFPHFLVVVRGYSCECMVTMRGRGLNLGFLCAKYMLQILKSSQSAFNTPSQCLAKEQGVGGQ